MSDTLGLWVGRLIIVVILVVIGYFIGMFAASIKKQPNESAAAAAERADKYEKVGGACGLAIGAIWVLIVAGKDHKQRETYATRRIGDAYAARLAAEPRSA